MFLPTFVVSAAAVAGFLLPSFQAWYLPPTHPWTAQKLADGILEPITVVFSERFVVGIFSAFPGCFEGSDRNM